MCIVGVLFDQPNLQRKHLSVEKLYRPKVGWVE
jgi:hypothetical protein